MVLDGQNLLEPDGEMLLLESYEILRRELKLYDAGVYEKDFVIAVNKTDLVPDNAVLEKVRDSLLKYGKEVYLISAATGDGIKDFVAGLYRRVSQSHKDALSAGKKEKKAEKTYTVSGEEIERRKISIEKTEEGYIVRNIQLERMVAMTDLENEEALDYLMNRLKRMKVGDRLKSLGIDEGSTVIIGKLVFDLVD
jgi:GTP-binding protein